MKIKELKELCLKVIKVEKENSKALHKYYTEFKGKSYRDFIKTKKGSKTDAKLKKANDNLNKVIKTDCTEYSGEYCLDVQGILKVIDVLEK